MSLSKKLRELLFEKHMTPSELAKQSGVSIPTVHRIVTGKTNRPNAKALEAISDFFGITVGELKSDDTQSIRIPENSIFKKVPLLEWEKLNKEINYRNAETYLITNNASNSAFALKMYDTSMMPFIEKDSILIFDPEIIASDRSYCLIKIHNFDKLVIRQLIVDVDNRFIKSFNKDIGDRSIRLLSDKDEIIAKLIEVRKQI